MSAGQAVRERAAVEALQRERLARLLAELPRSPFYARKLAGHDLRSIAGPADLTRLPFTTKAELAADQAAQPPYGTLLSEPLTSYTRTCQTSGTAGQPLRWLDTPASWSWMLDCWESLYTIAGIEPADRLFFAFSFGPFLGFWTAFDAAARRGNLCLPGGGLGSAARLRMLLDHRATVVLSTPTYALRLAEVARAEGIDLASSPVRAVLVAGEPGGSMPAIRQRIEAGWGARVIDHSGMTEVGPVAIECRESPGGLHILDTDYLAEVVEPASGRSAAAGEVGELVLTNLGRRGSPLLRYRTGDRVRLDVRPCLCGRPLSRLEGGILGRTDDMIHLRGNNLHPAALEALILRFAEVAEFRVAVDTSASLPQLHLEVEPMPECDGAELAARVAAAIRDEFLFRAEVRAVPPGSLPRFEMKARRWSRR